jgi:hypothetical protein
MLKHMDAVLPADHLFLPTLCTQHRNGNVIEQLTHLLGNLSGCFCVSRVLNSRHTVQQLRRRTGAALEQDLVVLDSEPAGIQAEWAEARSLTRSFLRLVAMFDASSKDSADSDEALPVAVELSDGHAQLLDFFNGPWSGLFFWRGVSKSESCRAVVFFAHIVCAVTETHRVHISPHDMLYRYTCSPQPSFCP